MLAAAFLLGFTGSLHCIGMCGPLAIQVKAVKQSGVLINRILYNSGRIITYSLLGLLAGTFGHLIAMSGWQGWFSILLGAIVLCFLFLRRAERWVLPKTISAISMLKRGISRFINQKSAGSSLLMGLLNGALPCGLVYAAVVLSLVQPGLSASVLVMIVFGIGTVPAMLTAAWSYRVLAARLPIPVRKIQVFFVGVMAFIMIWRGVSIVGLFSIDQTILCYPLH